MSDETGRHIPVLLREVVTAASLQDGDVAVDGTFGAGGYSRALLDAAGVTLYAIDRDPDAVRRAATSMTAYEGRFHMLEGCFGDMQSLLDAAGIRMVDAVVLDIGVSSFQLDEAGRGFSFQSDGPLDMRMGGNGMTAADVVNEMEEGDLANIIYRYGDEPRSRRIAAEIIKARADGPITRTLELGNIVKRAVGGGYGRGRPASSGKKKIHPATKTFQALRIYVNDELGELVRGLAAAERVLRPGGRLVVVSFHSLEDRIVKEFMAVRSGRTPSSSRHMPYETKPVTEPSFTLTKKGTIKPSETETKANPRARSARLRCAVRTSAPVWQEGRAA